MKKHSTKLEKRTNQSNIGKLLREPILNFHDYKMDQIFICSEKYFVADLYICEDTDDDSIFIGITFNPHFETYLDYIESQTINFLSSERRYDISKLDIAKVAFDW